MLKIWLSDWKNPKSFGFLIRLDYQSLLEDWGLRPLRFDWQSNPTWTTQKRTILSLSGPCWKRIIPNGQKAEPLNNVGVNVCLSKETICCLIPICIIQVYWSGNTVDWIEDLIWLQSFEKIWIWLGFGFETIMIGFEK